MDTNPAPSQPPVTIAVDPATDTFEVPIGGKKLVFRHLTVRESRRLDATLADVSGKSGSEAIDAVIAAVSPHCVSHTSDDLLDLSEDDVAILPPMISKARSISLRGRAELKLAAFFAQAASAGDARAANASTPLAQATS